MMPKIQMRQGMADIICFPLNRRQKLLQQLRRASTDNEVRFALKRTAESLARVGVPLATIDAQIRLISLMTRRQMWSCRPGGCSMNGETLRATLEHCRDVLDEAVRYADQSYQFGPNAYAYEALMRCTTARDTVARLAATITDISHYVDAFEQRGAA